MPWLTHRDWSMLERSDKILRKSADIIARAAQTAIRSRHRTIATWERIHATDTHMAAQTGRIILTYLGNLLPGQQRVDSAGSTNRNPPRPVSERSDEAAALTRCDQSDPGA
jgi:hypothetical protein